MTDHELLSKMLGLPHALSLSRREQKAFVQMFPRSLLSDKQREWIRSVAERLEIK